MVKKALAVLALTTGVVLSGAALAEPSRFDGSWSVQLVADGGLLCRIGTSQAERVRQPCPPASRCPRLGLGQAVGHFGLGKLDGSDAGVLRALDGAAPDRHRSGELKRPEGAATLLGTGALNPP